MADIDRLLQRLERFYSTIGSRRATIPQKRIDKELNPLFEQICAAYMTAPVDERVDVYLGFEARDNLLDAMVVFGGNSAYKASELAKTGKREKALPLVKAAVAADAIVDGRGDDQLIERAQNFLLDAAGDTGFDLAPYAAQLDLSANHFAKRAMGLHKEAQHLSAAMALGIALQMEPTLDQHEKVVNLAKLLTGKPASAAVTMLREPFQREKFITESRSHGVANRTVKKSRDTTALQFWLVTLFGTVVLAVLPPLLFPVVFGMTADSSTGNTPPGLIVGVVTAVIYFAGRMKDRPR